MAKGACVVKGDMHGEGGVHGKGGACVAKGACVVKGDMCGKGGMHGEGGCAWYADPPLRDTTGQCAGGTHPTGMHSCLKKNYM